MFTGILVFLWAPLCLAEPPPVFPEGQLQVAHGGEVVTLGSVLDTSKATVVHLVTDYCGVTEANLKHLSTKADEFPNVNFIAILWYLGGSQATEFQCGDRSDCKPDGGKLVDEVAAYLPAGSKVKVVQDLYKVRASSVSSSDADTCKDKAENCADMIQKKDDCEKFSMIKDNCALSCKTCTPAATTTAAPTEAPLFTPLVCDYQCGAVWNWFGSTGGADLKWNMKEMIITFAPGGCLHGSVNPPASSGGNPGPKLWDGELKTKVDAAIAAVAEASACKASATAPAPPPTAPASPAPAGDPAPGPAPEPAPAPAEKAATPAPTPAVADDKNKTTAPAAVADVSHPLQVSCLGTLIIVFSAFC